jgi:hypothetical protein
MLSQTSDRSDATFLDDSSIVQGDEICVFVQSETDINQVTFFLDGSFQRTERIPPFDFSGTGPNRSCNLFNTTSLSVGQHTISAEIEFDEGSAVTREASFVITPEP